MAVLGATVIRAAHAFRRSDTLSVLDSIRDEPFVAAAEARSRQLQRLQRLLLHCEQNVPYYAARWRAAGVRAADVRSLADLRSFPVLTKGDIREAGDELIARNVDRGTLMPHQSGGSTGVPLRFYRDMAYVAASEAGTYRNLMQCGWAPGEMIAFFWGSNDRLESMSAVEFVARQWFRRMYQFDPFRSGPDDMERWWRTWKLIRPRVALGYASTIARFARWLEERGERPAPLRGAFTTAEKLYQPQREVIERVFGCRVFDCYGSSEVQNIATECHNGSMHVNADYAVVDVADPGSAQVQPLLLTSLKNFAMPLVRYRNEDCGRLLDGECDCGIGFPLMSLDVARVSDNFTLPNGRVVHGEFFTHLMYGSEGIDSFQFHQTAPGRIVLRYVRASSGDPAASVARAAEQVRALDPDRVRVDVEEVADIEKSHAGKHRFTRSDVS